MNRFAIFNPYGAHSLDPSAKAAVDCCLEAVNFVAVFQEIYTFFHPQQEDGIPSCHIYHQIILYPSVY